jgi:Cellulase (glycosyl hydrolase family 5)
MSSLLRRNLITLAATVPFVSFEHDAKAKKPENTVFARYFGSGFTGFNIGGSLLRAGERMYFDALEETQCNCVRIFFHFAKVKGEHRYEATNNERGALQRVLKWLEFRGIKAIVVAYFGELDDANFWTNSALNDSFVACWAWFATEFKNDAAIVGLDLLNEPNPPWDGKSSAHPNFVWRGLAHRAIDAIRRAGCSIPIVYEGYAGGHALGLRGLEPFDDPNIVYSIHLYSPHDITHQLLNERWSRKIPYPCGPEWNLKNLGTETVAWDYDQLNETVVDAVSFQRRFKVPIYVGEFSCARWAPGQSALNYVGDCLKLFRQHGWSWSYLDFRGDPVWDAEIESTQKEVTERKKDAPIMRLLKKNFSVKRA